MIVAFTVSGDREKYLRQALDAWLKVRGIEDVQLVFCVEPAARFPVSDFARWVDNAFPCPTMVYPNPRRLQCLENTKKAFDTAFGMGTDFAVMAEEDIEPAADVLEYLAWVRDAYREDKDVIMACAHAKDGEGEPWQAVRASWFNPLICGTWKDRWESFVRPGWAGLPPNDRGVEAWQAWDTNLRERIRNAGKYSVFPVLSRALHFGEFSTWLNPTLSSELFRDSKSLCFTPDTPPQEYREVPWGSVGKILVLTPRAGGPGIRQHPGPPADDRQGHGTGSH